MAGSVSEPVETRRAIEKKMGRIIRHEYPPASGGGKRRYASSSRTCGMAGELSVAVDGCIEVAKELKLRRSLHGTASDRANVLNGSVCGKAGRNQITREQCAGASDPRFAVDRDGIPESALRADE
jgi:hypothetical protein